MQEHKGPVNEQCVECGVELNLSEVALVILLSRQDLGNKMVPVEEPLVTKYIKNLENRWAIFPRANHRGSSSGGEANSLRGRRGVLSSPLRGARRGRKTAEGDRHEGMVVVRGQEAMLHTNI